MIRSVIKYFEDLFDGTLGKEGTDLVDLESDTGSKPGRS